MKSSSLILGLLFFTHSFCPEQSGTVFAMAGAFFTKSPKKDYDAWLMELITQFDPPRKSTLVLTQKPVQSSYATVYWPKEHEPTIELMHRNYGLVVLDITEPETHTVPTWLLRYCNDMLIYGGKLVVTDGETIFMAMEKN